MEHVLSETRLVAMVALGIGLVIFVHELGHFLAARWCGVRVETFSLGFGPKLLGWKRGPTTYQIALVPLGGYVKMAGEESTGGAPGPDELGSKTVGQRFLIFSGGVIMNVIFALVVFPLIMLVGVPLSAPLVGATIPGSPAWRAGLEPGTRVLEVNGKEVHQFPHILTEVALGSPDRAELVVLDPGASAPRTVTVTPEHDADVGVYGIGVVGSVDPDGQVEVARDSAAAAAGLRTGDRVVGVEGALAGLRLQEQIAVAGLGARPLRLLVRREGASAESAPEVVEVAPKLVEVGGRMLGIESAYARVVGVRGRAAHLDLRRDDRIVSVAGKPVLRAFDLERALADLPAGTAPVFRVERDGSELDVTGPALAAGEGLRFARDVGLAPVEGGSIVAVRPGLAAARAGLLDGDRIVRAGDRPIERFREISEVTKALPAGAKLLLGVERVVDGTRTTLSFEVEPGPMQAPDYGFALREATYVMRVSSPVEAVAVGLTSSWRFVEDAYLTLKRVLLGQVASKNIGGIITIGVVSHSWAADGWAKLLFFLCMLSMNLAFLNVLPIPVLDGGHLLFLLVEKIKGSPVSERVMGYSQMVGVVLIVSLMVYVLYNDVRRWIVPG